ncbi:MAG: hypothetical protein LC770_02090 [Acidobacteria bacterium]|nr:hypothetical protein [Acidobacteriota bacterium]
MFACICGKGITDGVSLAEFATAFSPLVEETSVDTVVIDAEGCELLFGSANELANQIAKCAARPKESAGLGCKVNVALAGNPDAAIHAARFFQGITFISSGEELTCLGELPISELSPKSKVQSSKSKTCNSISNKQTLDIGPWTLDEKKRHEEIQKILETLRLWGVRTFRDFARLPVAGISERLGQEGIRLQQLASGKTERHLKLKQPAPVFENSIELEHALAELEPLSFIFARLLNQLCASLNAYALATNELRVRMKLEDETFHECRLNLPSPMRDPKVVLKVFRPPLRALVEANRGYPTQISAWGSNRSVHGKVVRLGGPWRTTGDWWREDRWARDEWDVTVEKRAEVSPGKPTPSPLQVIYRIYRELSSDSWFVEGIYD